MASTSIFHHLGFKTCPVETNWLNNKEIGYLKFKRFDVPERQLISSANDLIVFTMCDVLEFHYYIFALVACEYQIRLVLSGYLNFLL